MTSKTQSDKDRVVIFDTTLRDGEQCPGATMTHEEKLEVAELLDAMGVDIIEAGFPIASDGDFAAVHEIAKRSKNAVICGLSRAGIKDIDRCAEAVKPAKRKRIHTFLSTSPVHMKYKLQKEPHEVYEMVIAQVTRARSHTDDVEWSPEDATRTELDFLCRCVEAAIKAGATTINIPDTVGYTTPEEYSRPVQEVRERVPNSDNARLLDALPQRSRHGGRQLARRRQGGRAPGRMHHQRHRRARRQRGAGRSRDGDEDAQRRAAVLDRHRRHHAHARLQAGVGGDFVPGAVQQGDRRAQCLRARERHSPGRHAEERADLRDHDAGSVGVKQTSLVMGKHSGRHAFVHKLDELGYHLGVNQVEDAFVRFKALADKKKQIYDEDIEALVDEEIAHAHDRIKIVSLTVIAGTIGPQSATLSLDIDGNHVTTQSTGNGPVDAIFNAIHALVPHEAKLELYQVHAVTEGTDAQAEVSVRLSQNGRSVTAKGADPDAGGVGQGLSGCAQQADQQAQPDAGDRAAYPFHRCGLKTRAE